jgi:hypothetical protein
MEAVCAFEAWAKFYETARRYITEDSALHPGHSYHSMFICLLLIIRIKNKKKNVFGEH